jgi:hypothetical protein
MNVRTQVLEASLELLWFHWSELGVPGVRDSSHRRVAVSPTDLALFTPAIVGDRDARLTSLAAAWCVQHGARTFGARELAARSAVLAPPVRSAYAGWAAALHHAAGAPWPAPDEPLAGPLPPVSDRELPFRSDRPSAVHLRARSLFGVGVRADVVCALLAADAARRPMTSRDVAHLGHTPRAVQWTMVALEAAGVVQAVKEGRTHTHSLTRPQELAGVLDAEGLVWFPWQHAYVVIFHLVALAARPNAVAQDVVAHALAASLAPHVQALHGLPVIPVRPGDDDAATRLLAWGSAALASFVGVGA